MLFRLLIEHFKQLVTRETFTRQVQIHLKSRRRPKHELEIYENTKR